ncbi:MAG: DUF2953 domain-containing protein [Butyricicoccus sp.]|nr:DUF2953 domain-containing protein [Butyricicoccus sp.]MBQ8585625.1 DUF2953 domain-containing protein [Butyricicoccus sp.]
MAQILSILGTILGVLLLIVLGLIILVHLLLIPRVGVYAAAKNGEVKLKVRYSWLKILVFQLPKKEGKKKPKKPKKPKPKKEKKPKDENAEEKPGKKLNFKALDWGDTICFFLNMLLRMKNTLRLDIVRVDAVLATGNAAKTGKLLGQIAQWVSIIYAFLMEHFNLKTCHIYVDGDFDGSETKYDAEVSLSLRPIVLEWVVISSLPKLYRIYKTLTKTEAETNE